MATVMSYNSSSPAIACKNYEDWKKLMNIWTELATLEKKKQGPTLVLTSADISSEERVTKIITRLDKIGNMIVQTYKMIPIWCTK